MEKRYQASLGRKSLGMSVAVLAGTILSLEAQNPATSTLTSAPSKAAEAPKAGVINDWLRANSTAWTPWDIGAQVRLRYELFDNGSPAFPTLDFQSSGADNDVDYIWLREKVHVGYTSTWFGAFVQGRNSDAWGDEDPRNLGQDSIDLHQAFVTLGNAKKFPLTAKVGRQELSYGDERLIGAADWSNTGRVFDAAKLRLEGDLGWIDAFASQVVLNDDGEFNESDSHDRLFGVYGSSKKLIPIQETQLYVLSRNTDGGSDAGTAPRDIVSVGTRVKSAPGKLKGWDYTAEMVGQFGTITQGGERRDHRAFASSAGGGYTWATLPGTPRLGAEYNFSTGDSDPNDDTNETLDNLFPTNHRHYGLMDFVGWRNIHNPRVSLSAKPHKRVNVSLDYHLFWLADTHDFFYPQGGGGRNGAGYGRNSSFSSYAGSEIDLDVSYTITDWAGVRGGFGHFFPGQYVEDSKQGNGGSTGANWFYVQATLSF